MYTFDATLSYIQCTGWPQNKSQYCNTNIFAPGVEESARNVV